MAFHVNALRHPKERIYGALMLWIGALVWLAVAAGAVLSPIFRIAILPSVVYLVVIWLVLTIARVLIRAHMFGHHVLVGPDQFPHIHAMVEEGARQLGLAEAPMTFVYNSQGVMNAFALRLIGKQRYVWIASALIDADTDEQLRFVIGHELGHHVAGHLDALPHVVRLGGFLIPALGPAYSRARELTCDRIGAVVAASNPTTARSALQLLACGSAKLNREMNPTAFGAQDAMVPPVAGFFVKLFASHPRHTRRVEAVGQWLGQAQAGAVSPAAEKQAA